MSRPVPDRGLGFMDVPDELASLIRAHDWTDSPLGAPEGWPQSLRTVLQIMLTSRYAMWMGWGEELTFFCNDAYRPTLGAKRDWLGAPAARVWEEIWPDVGPRIEHVLATGAATWDEALMLILERNGFPEESYHTFSYSPLSDDDGSITGMLCVVTEVTSRVLGDRRLHLLRDLALQVANARTTTDVWDGVRASLLAGSRDLPLVGCYLFDGPEEHARSVLTIGTKPGTLVNTPAWPLDRIREGARELLVDDGSGLASIAWQRPCTQALIVPIAAAGESEPIGAFVAGINPFRPLDAEYRGFIDLFVGQIAAALASANAFEAERKRAEALALIDRAKTAFFSNVSHEFRTPLTLMLGPLEDALAETEPGGRQHERLAAAHRNSVRLLRLVNSLLDFSRIESGRAEANFRPTNLAALTSELASSFRSATDKAGLRLIVDTPTLAQPAYVDREMWEKIVLNLLSNAFKFTFAGEIEVALREVAGERVRLTVRDTGTGIPAAELPRLFERFHRVEGAAGRSFEGSGIGLALVQELVRQHGGEIHVESEVDHGTTFHVDIPSGAAHLPADQVTGARDGDRATSRSRGYVEEALRWLPGANDATFADEPAAPSAVAKRVDAERVLLADDSADLRAYIARLLEEHGYDVATVDDGVAALAAVRAQRPDVLITDVMMPRLDGFGLVAAIRADATVRDLPIIMLSARAGEESQIEGLAAGADDYLIKPFSARELLARVDATIGMARIRAEAAESIRATEARSAAVLEGMAEGYILVDHDFQVVRVNAEAVRKDGHDVTTMIGQPFASFWPWAAQPEQFAALRRAMDARVPVTLPDIALAGERDDQWIEVRAYPTGKDGLAVFLRDISDRKRVERELQTLNENLEELVAQRTHERDRAWNNTQDLLLVLDREGIFQAVNPAWNAVLGLRDPELIGHHVLEFIHPDDHAATRAALTTGRVSHLAPFENRYLHKDGSHRWISWVAAPEGDLIYASGRDVTAEKEAEAELEQARDQLRQSQKMEAVGQLTGGLAHDFNNLLTGITGSLELLQARVRKGQTGEFERYVTAAQGAARRAAALTHRLLAFSRRQTLDPKPTDVNRLIADLEDLIRRTVGLSVEIEVIGSAGLWTALVDQNQLESALLNLCINGRDAMPNGGRLTIETANKWLDERAAKERDLPPGQYLSICVTDNGTGMTPEVRERAFDPFFTTKPLGAGTGLGLSMVYGFARQSGGQVRIYSELGQGTTICIYLPRHVADPVEDIPEIQLDPAVIDGSTSGRTVLVVDDEPTVRMLVVEVLDAMGCSTIEAHDGATGLKVLQSGARIDLLITDVGLPGGINGRQVADAGRSLRSGLRVLFITGYAENAAIGNGYLEPGMQVLTKPFPIDALTRRINELLVSGPAAS